MEDELDVGIESTAAAQKEWKDLRAFSESAQRLSCTDENPADLYPKQWVAVRGGQVVVHENTFDKVLCRLDADGLPREDTIIRCLSNEHRTMIL